MLTTSLDPSFSWTYFLIPVALSQSSWLIARNTIHRARRNIIVSIPWKSVLLIWQIIHFWNEKISWLFTFSKPFSAWLCQCVKFQNVFTEQALKRSNNIFHNTGLISITSCKYSICPPLAWLPFLHTAVHQLVQGLALFSFLITAHELYFYLFKPSFAASPINCFSFNFFSIPMFACLLSLPASKRLFSFLEYFG